MFIFENMKWEREKQKSNKKKIIQWPILTYLLEYTFYFSPICAYMYIYLIFSFYILCLSFIKTLNWFITHLA